MRLGIDDGTSGFRIDPLCPCHLRKGLSGYESAADTIENIVETVLVCLHQDLALPSIDGEIRKDEPLDAVVVPRIARNRLVIPLQLAGVRLYGQDRTNK